MSLLPVTVLRLDGGGADERGDYRCTAPGCTWKASQAVRGASINHVQRHHPGHELKVVRTGEAEAAYQIEKLNRKRKRQASSPVVIMREDAGARGSKGDFRCMEAGCGWWARGVWRNDARRHALSAHGDRPSTVVRPEGVDEPVRREETDEEKKEEEEERGAVARRAKNAAAVRKHRAAAKEKASRLASAERPSVWPLAIADATSRRFPVSAYITPGSGRRTLVGNFNPVGKEAAEVAITFVSIHLRAIRSWLTQQPPTDEPLQNRASDVTLAVGGLDLSKQGSSAGACQALALTSLVSGRTVHSSRLAVTGSIDLRGRLVVVGGAEGKVEQAYRDRLDLLVMPSSNLRRLKTDGWSQELKAYAAESVKGADNFIELLELTVQGFERGEGMVSALLDGPQVGVGRSMGLCRTDNVCEYEVQCCYVSPGKQQLIKTGNLSRASIEAMELVRARVVADTPRIAELLGLAKAGLRLVKPRLDLHVHVSHTWSPIDASYQMAAMYVAMVALMTGRRSRADTLVFGNVDERGALVGESWGWTESMVRFTAYCGYRRLVVGRGVGLDDAARAAAEEEVGQSGASGEGSNSGRRRLEITVCGDDQALVELLPMLLE